MILNIRVMPKSSCNCIKKENDTLKVYLTKPAQDGLANKQLIDLLSEYFKVKKYQIRIIRGEKSRNKVIQIDLDAAAS
jgi:uncharacterized protein (TIGR00251 family)